MNVHFQSLVPMFTLVPFSVIFIPHCFDSQNHIYIFFFMYKFSLKSFPELQLIITHTSTPCDWDICHEIIKQWTWWIKAGRNQRIGIMWVRERRRNIEKICRRNISFWWNIVPWKQWVLSISRNIKLNSWIQGSYNFLNWNFD